MNLVLATPASWRATAPGRFVVDEELVIESMPVGPLPDDPVAWARMRLAEPGLELASEREIVTGSGWPALVFEWRAGDVRKLLFLFQILEYGAATIVRGPEKLYLAHAEEVLRVLGAAEVEWGEQPLTLAAIWQGFA